MKRAIRWARQARIDLGRLSRQDSDRIERAVEQLAISGQGHIVKLKGFAVSHYRFKVGDWLVRCRF